MKSHITISTVYRTLLGAAAVVVALTCQSCGGSPPSEQSQGPSMLKARGSAQDTATATGQDGAAGQDGATGQNGTAGQASAEGAAEPPPEKPAKLKRGSLFAQADADIQAMQQEQQQQEQQQQQASNRVTTDTGLQYEEIVVGNGAQPAGGQTVSVHYTGWLTDGTKFDSSLDKGQPFQFVLGAREVIRGWDEGVSTMRIGGKRRLIVPPDLGYGDRGAGGVIPPGATLVFEVELLGIQ